MAADDNVIQFPGGGATAQNRPPLLGFDPFARDQPTLLPRRPERVRFTVHIDLDDALPPIWRKLQLAGDLRLNQLHDILQVAMGWTDSHLHHFVMGPGPLDRRIAPFVTPFAEVEGDEGIHEADVRLDEVVSKPDDRLYYEYDFGDGWEHTILVEKVEQWNEGDPLATCLAGQRACPPEDVGGVGGYGELLDIIAGHTETMEPEYVEQVLNWLPEGYDPDAFSVDEVNDLLEVPELPPLTDWHPAIEGLFQRVYGPALAELTRLVARAAEGSAPSEAEVGALARRYQFLLRTVGTGITLTAAGYLPPKTVDLLYRELDMDDGWIGKGNREDMTAPVLNLRTSATTLGLLRKSRGKLTVTAAGTKVVDDPAGLLRHIAARVPLGKPHEKDAGLIALLIMAAGDNPYHESEFAGRIMFGLGWRIHGDEYGRAAYQWAHSTIDVIRSLGGWLGKQQHTRAAQALLRRP